MSPLRSESVQYAPRGDQRTTTNSSRRMKKLGWSGMMCLVMKVKSDAVTKTYCIGTWNVGSMNQGKLDMVKQEMTRVNINILGINELKWTGIGELNSDEHYIYYCGQELHRRNGAALTINKNSKCSTWVQPQKWQNYFSSFLRQTIQHHSHPSLCPNHGCWRNWSWSVLWKPTRLPRTNTKKKKKCPIHHRGLECNSRKSRNTWSNRQLWLWCTKRSRAKSNRILPRESTGHRKHPFFNSTRDDFTHRHHQKVNIEIRLITFSVAKDGEAVYSQQKQDLELTVAQIISSS